MALTNAPRQSSPDRAASLRQNRLRAFRPDIEGLRAVAVLAVVLDHSRLAVHGGYVGVDVFFVISGFLITSHLYRELSGTGHISIMRFYARRVRRILPAATLVIIATLLAAWIWGSPLAVHSTGFDAITAALFCINFRIAETGANYFANPSPSPFQQYWSLAIEEQFYALWPLLLLAVSAVTHRLRSSRTAISAFLAIVIAGSLFCSVTLTHSSPSWAYFGLQTRAWELALGAFVAINADVISRLSHSAATSLSWIGLGAIIVASLCFTGTTPYPGMAVALPVVGAAFVVAAGCAGQGLGAETALGVRPLQYVGRVSYSWYLWHWPVLIFLPEILGHTPTNSDTVLAIVVSFVFASLSYALVEQPFRKSQRLVTQPRRGLFLGAGLIGVSIISAVLVMTLVVVPTTNGSSVRVTDSVTTNVALGAGLHVLPTNLSPPLSAVPSASPYACIAPLSGYTFGPQGPWTPTCTLGDVAATKTVVLFGDSHAWQWTPPIAAIAKSRGWKLDTYTKAACPVDTMNFRANDSVIAPDLSHCAQWRHATLARLSKLRPAVVIMTSRTYSFDTPRALTQTISDLKADGSKIVWIDDTPIPDVVIPTCLSEYPTAIERCNVSRTGGLDYPTLRDSLDSTAAHDGAVIIDPVPWLCTAKVCPAVISNTAVYFDDSHLAKAYTLKLTQVLTKALSSTMPMQSRS
jgi:peptidoglycan/LPS O-acetylase OafA/YrhL